MWIILNQNISYVKIKSIGIRFFPRLDPQHCLDVRHLAVPAIPDLPQGLLKRLKIIFVASQLHQGLVVDHLQHFLTGEVKLKR